MPTLVYGQSMGITVPAGYYTGKFLGTEDRPPMDGSRFGKGQVPRMAWVWEILDGQHKGERLAQETGVVAVPKSGCARVILGLAGGQIQTGKAVNTDEYVGKTYRLKVAVNPDSDKGNLHVADIEPLAAGASNSATSPPPRPSAPPPPRQAAPAFPGAPGDTRKFWMQPDGATEPVLDTATSVQNYIAGHKLDPKVVQVCIEGGSEWKPASDFGFKDSCPW